MTDNGMPDELQKLKGSRRVTVSVGGEIFETTVATLQSGGHGSLLARSAPVLPSDPTEIFFDRDPSYFKILLNFLRTRKLPASFDKDALIEEASFYGLLRVLKEAMAPDHLNGIDLHKKTNLLPTGRDYVNALCASPDGSIIVSHGSKLTDFDWALRKGRTTLTEFNTIDSLHRLSDTHVACGSEGLPGLHIYDFVNGKHAKSLIWSDKNDTRVYNASVRSICSNATTLFAAYENGHKLENTVQLIDRLTLQVTGELARQNGNATHLKVATKLHWLATYNWLMTVGVHGGTFGYSGYIRLWDVRQKKHVWEWREPNVQGVDPRLVERDCFADIAVDEDHAGIFKVSLESGNIAMADMRHLKAQDPWMTLTDVNPEMNVKEKGTDSKLLCYNKQIFCSRGSDLEVWSEVPLAGTEVDLDDREYWETSFRRNFVEHTRWHGGHDISLLNAGGQYLFVARKFMQGVEVWETRRASTL
ncbi:hypothetical protein KP509_33G047100 [Ceratopteris richardii]|uniref:BTB domain-containing protein n=1 Tax=Ceratopteris richardii TaxID=49495 RepID=A0A8T2QNP1_CERRI|nr:hypothetical protein KP509_33G047100 [Ceratopteris richardii]